MGGLEMLYNSNDIQKIIPHRYPFLLVDCIESISEEENKGKIAFFAGINKARFRKQVIPGDVLTMTVTLTKEKGGIYFAAIEAKVEDEIAVTGEIMCAVGE